MLPIRSHIAYSLMSVLACQWYMQSEHLFKPASSLLQSLFYFSSQKVEAM